MAEQQESPSNIKYFAFHETWQNISEIFRKTAETFTMWGRSEHDPVSPQPAAQLRLPFGLTTRILYWKIHDFPACRNMATVELHQILTQNWMYNLHLVELHWISHVPRKLIVQLVCNLIKYCACHEQCFLSLYYSFLLLFFASAVLLFYGFLAMILWLYSTICLPYFSLNYCFWRYYSLTLLCFYSIFDSAISFV